MALSLILSVVPEICGLADDSLRKIQQNTDAGNVSHFFLETQTTYQTTYRRNGASNYAKAILFTRSEANIGYRTVCHNTYVNDKALALPRQTSSGL
jgi:hypothetical protein